MGEMPSLQATVIANSTNTLTMVVSSMALTDDEKAQERSVSRDVWHGLSLVSD